MEIRIKPVKTAEVVKGLIGLPSETVRKNSFLCTVLPGAAQMPLRMLFSVNPTGVTNKAMNAVNGDNGVLSSKLDTYLKKNHIDIDIGQVKIRTTEGNQYIDGVWIEIVRINYTQLIERFLPDILERTVVGDNELFGGIMSILGDDRDRVIKSVMSILDNRKKEELIKLILRVKRRELCYTIDKFASKNGIILETHNVIL